MVTTSKPSPVGESLADVRTFRASMPSFSHLRLQSDRLTLRPMQGHDAPALFAIHSDPAVMRYWSVPPWTSIEQARESIASDIGAMEAGHHLRLGLERKEDSALLGTCSLFNLHAASRRAELGYALDARAWGRGYMSEALVALVEYAFAELTLNRIEADIDPRNEASARSLARLGFKREGHLRERWIVDGEVSDTAFFGLLRSDWMSLRHRDN
jgi:ribosomal-protein-alanine N-acetyltransferase